MPIDASIPLQGRPVQVPNPMESYGRALSLKALIQRGKMNQIALEESERKRKDEEIARKVYADWDGKDWNQFRGSAAKAGMSPQMIGEFDKQYQENRRKTFEADEAETKQRSQINDRFLGAYGEVNDASDDELPTVWSTARGRLIGEGIATEEQLPAEFPGREWLKIVGVGLKGQKQLFNEAQERRRTKATEERATAATASSQSTQARNAAQTLNSQWDTAAKTAPDNQEQWATWHAALPEAVRKQISPTHSEAERKRVQNVLAAGRADPARMKESTEQGTYLIDPRTGESVEAKTPAGQPIKKSIAGGEGTLARERFEQVKTQAGTTRMDTAQKEQSALQAQEQELHRKRERLGRLLKMNAKNWKGGGKFKATDPEGKKIEEYTGSENLDEEFHRQLTDVNAQIAELQGRQKKIRGTHGLGEYTRQPGQSVPISQLAAGGPEAIPAAAPGAPAQQPTGAPKKWTIKGVTYTEGQLITGPGGKSYRIKNVVNGKIDADPV